MGIAERRAHGSAGGATDSARAAAAAGYTFGVCDVHLTVNSVRLEKINDCRLIYTCVGRRTHAHTRARRTRKYTRGRTHTVTSERTRTHIYMYIARSVLNTTAANTNVTNGNNIRNKIK